MLVLSSGLLNPLKSPLLSNFYTRLKLRNASTIRWPTYEVLTINHYLFDLFLFNPNCIALIFQIWSPSLDRPPSSFALKVDHRSFPYNFHHLWLIFHQKKFRASWELGQHDLSEFLCL